VAFPVKCCLLTVSASSWFVQLVRIAPGLSMGTVDARDLGLDWSPNPCGLARSDRLDVVLVSSDWYKWLAARHPDRVDPVFERLRRMADRIVALEGHDLFSLSLPPGALDRVDLVLKGQGIYRDRELYNYRVGPFFAGANWTAAIESRRVRYTHAQLEKLRLSVPCFLAIDARTRHRIRLVERPHRRLETYARLAAEAAVQASLPLVRLRRPKHLTAHFVGTLTHRQRLDLLEILRSAGVPGSQAITRVPEDFYGTGALERSDTRDRPGPVEERLEEHDLRTPPPEEDPAEPGDPPALVTADGVAVRVPPQTVRALGEALRRSNLGSPPMSRPAFTRSLARSGVVLAPAGFGEITFRHAEAFIVRRPLICQDLSHVETMYPFADRHNAIFCRPDLTDVAGILREVERGDIPADEIAGQGQRCWRDWLAGGQRLLHRGITGHLEERGDPYPRMTPAAAA
jgi:hypothetical protein